MDLWRTTCCGCPADFRFVVQLVVHTTKPQHVEASGVCCVEVHGSLYSHADTTYRIWRKADWIGEDVERVFRLNEQTGHVVVRQAGVYLLYAQVTRASL